jgi:hypothetical protein
MLYVFEETFDNFYTIYTETKYYGLLLKIGVVEGKEGMSSIFLLDENDAMVCKMEFPFSYLTKLYNKPVDVVEHILEEFAEMVQKEKKLDFGATFRKIRKHMKRKNRIIDD